jgi:hypothetical protein
LNRQEAILQQLAEAEKRKRAAGEEKDDEPDEQKLEEEARELEKAQTVQLPDQENVHHGPTNVLHE